MLQIQHIKKDYKTGNLVQHALNDVSLSLRDNEFVAILGPSGSGKTTLLNVVGGLDRYDSGDLIINGVSTKKYKDRDWDAYRNHTIGFVFQSYNLIMHQSVLSNVELALTISGISGKKRREMAENALRKVGLAEQMHKKPGQMSGGQMQRVAIARALVNDPDIVLADEPTGALDSETSVQIMDLLKEVAKDRLVVMVTHNPELARAYATRIVTFKDGHVIDDTQPFEPELKGNAPIHKRLGRASMSFATALGLSFNNLKTKKARTLLVSFAGSIGIIGIALILALSTGVNTYIKNMEEETLSEYPLQLRQTGMDFSALMSNSFVSSDEGTVETKERQIPIRNIVESMFGDVDVNDLGTFKTYLEQKQEELEPYVRAVEYNYSIKPLIYQEEEGKAALKVNPSDLVSTITGGGNVFSSMMGSSSGMDIFYQLPANKALYEEAYELKAGSWPKDSSDLVLVLSQSGSLTDLVPYVLNIKDQEALKERLDTLSGSKKKDQDAGSSQKETESDELETISYDEFLGRQFRLVNNSAVYVYDTEYEIWTNKSDNEEYMADLIRDGKVLTITGIVSPKDDSSAAMLSSGIGYTWALTQELIREAEESDIVKAQMADKETNVFTGKPFGEESDGLDFGKLFNVDTDSIGSMFSNAFGGLGSMDLSSLFSGNMDLSNMDLSKMDLSDMDLSKMDVGGANMDLSKMLNMEELSKMLPSYSEEEIKALVDKIVVPKTGDDWNNWLVTLFTNVMNGYTAYIGDDSAANLQNLGAKVQEYLLSDSAREIMTTHFRSFLEANADNLLTEDELRSMVSQIVQGFAVYLMTNSSLLSDLTAGDGLDMLAAASKVSELFEGYLASSPQISAMQQSVKDRFSKITVTNDQVSALAGALYNGYEAWAKDTNNPNVEAISTRFSEYLGTDEAKALLLSSADALIDQQALTSELTQAFSGVMESVSKQMGAELSKMIGKIVKAITKQIVKAMNSAMKEFSKALQNSMSDLTKLFNIDPSGFGDMLSMNMSSDEIQELIASLMSGSSDTYENNLAGMGYADLAEPAGIDLYPRDFESKSFVTAFLDTYNQTQKDGGHEENTITYTDMVGTMMSSVTKIVNTISYVLIAFVAISLIVSSIMIGVITYISVLERRKEIGILRAIGASKGNISQVFNAETFITGLLAGSIGVGLTYLLTIPINQVIERIVNEEGVRAQLPIVSAAILVVLSIILTMVAGLLPSGKAAKSDPVAALRSD